MRRRKAHPAGEKAIVEFVKALDAISHSHRRLDNFRHFLEAAYSALAKRTAPNQERAEALEKRYMAVVDRYRPHEQEAMRRMSELFGDLHIVLADRAKDFLGAVYMESALGDEQLRQFFLRPVSLT